MLCMTTVPVACRACPTWTGRGGRSAPTGQGSIPASLAPIPTRLGIRAEHWLESVREFDRGFGHVVGSLTRLREAAHRAGRHWFRGVNRCAEAFA